MAKNYQQNYQALIDLGASPEWIWSQPGVGKRINPTELGILTRRWREQHPAPAPAPAPPALPSYQQVPYPQTFTYKPYSFQIEQQLPKITKQAESIYGPQRAQLEALRELQASMAKTQRIATKEDFARRMREEIEAINRRGAFFGGGAIMREQELRTEHQRALQQLDLQAQAAQFELIARQAGLSAQQAEYIRQQLFSIEGEAYKRYINERDFAWQAYQSQLGEYWRGKEFGFERERFERAKMESDREFAERLREFELSMKFDMARFKKEFGLSTKKYKQALREFEFDKERWGAEFAYEKFMDEFAAKEKIQERARKEEAERDKFISDIYLQVSSGKITREGAYAAIEQRYPGYGFAVYGQFPDWYETTKRRGGWEDDLLNSL